MYIDIDLGKKILALLTGGFFIYLAVQSFSDINMNSINPGSAIMAAVMCAFWSCCGGYILAYTFLTGVGYGIVDRIFGKKQYLSRPAPLLSPIRGMLERGDIQSARAGLAKLLNEYPFHPSVWYTMFELEHDFLKNPEAAAAVAERYLQNPRREPGMENFQLLNAYLEIRIDRGEFAEAAPLVRQELSCFRSCYRPREIKILKMRLANPSDTHSEESFPPLPTPPEEIRIPLADDPDDFKLRD